MNPPIKRILAFAGSVVAGLLGTIVLASPAQAHHPIISGTADCQADGKYKVTWTVKNGNWPNPLMKIITVTPRPNSPVTNVTVDTWLQANGSVTGVQYVPGTTTEATLFVEAEWYKRQNGVPQVEDSRTGTVTMPGTCKPEPNPTATFTDRCDGTVNVHLVNPTSTMKTFRIKGTDYDKNVEVPAKEEADEPVPASAGALVVAVKGSQSWTEIGRHQAWARPDECPPPTVFSWSDCDNFKIAVTNAEKAQAITATVTYGTQAPLSKPVAAGATEYFEFTPSSTTTATVELSGWDSKTMTYVKPQNCDELPKTGADTTTYIASGTGLAMLGGLAFFFARRRLANLRKLASS